MKKNVLLCLIVLIVLVSFAGCCSWMELYEDLSHLESSDISESEFNERCANYKEQLKDIDASLKIDEFCCVLGGNRIVDYTVETENGMVFGISVHMRSVANTTVWIDFNSATDNFTDYNIDLFCSFISVFSHNEISVEDLKNEVECMRFSERIELNHSESDNSSAYIYWSKDATLHYYEFQS